MRAAYRRILLLVILGITVIFFAAGLFVYRRGWEIQSDLFREEMVRVVTQLSSSGELFFLPHDQRYTDSFTGQVSRAAREYGASVWVCDPMGNVLIACDDTGMTVTPPIRDTELRPKLMPYLQESFFDLEQKGTVNFTNTFLYDSVTFGHPILLDNIRGTALGVVLLHVPQPNFAAELGSIVNILFAAYLLTLAFSILFVYYLYYRYGYVFSGIVRLAGKKPVLQMDETFHGQDESARALLNLERELNQQEAAEVAFVANASHELRSPMTSIQGFAQGMLDGVIPPEEQPHYLTVMIEESRRLNSLIRDLLDLSRIESQLTPKNFIRFELHEQIRRALIGFEGRIEEKRIEPKLEFATVEAYVLGDPDRLTQVFINLIDNAIKYTPEGGSIRVWTYPTLGDRLMVGVTDTGYGIPQEDIPYIFDRFYKVDTSHSQKTGTGLGLAIVKQIVEKHESTISVHSFPGRGTTFSFSLKRMEEE